ncbi:MAG: DUF58 domain-containing protein [Gammaproteobacteria bacterium]|nr:MAG: DUF58 domain-containing protein [Gammaproteobacteria bacterium]
MSATATATRPTRLLQPEVLAGLANLELVARAVVEGFLIGLHRSPRFGFSQEFAEYRAYAEGDDPRFIDWNVYARTDRAYIKRFLGETNSHLIILLDASASMGIATQNISKLRYGQFLAASLAYLASKQHDAVGTLIFDDQTRAYRPPSSRAGNLSGVLHTIDAAEPAGGTNLDHSFQYFQQQVTRRGLVAVISDFYCDPDEMIAGVRPLAFQGQDVILFQILDPGELKPKITESTLLEDVETGEAVEVSPKFMREQYPERIRAHIRALKDAAAGIGADHVLLNTAEPLDQPLRNYLLFRERRR